MIRYPGGNFSSVYHWEDGIGSKDLRPTRHDTAWQAEESNQVGTDEFLAFCAQMEIEPFFVVNDGSGSPEEAARWVEYCNGSLETDQGKRRALYGHVEPYGVKYWGIGTKFGDVANWKTSAKNIRDVLQIITA
jgi:alpha-N-arabinofuranosidase